MLKTGFHSRIHKRLSIVAMLGFFLAIAAWVIWPTPVHLFTAIPTGDSPIGTVPMFNAWSLWWNADRISEGLTGYWDAPILAPSRGAFAFSDPQPAMVAMAPFLFLSTLPAAYNCYALLAIALNGLLTLRLLRNCGCDLTHSVAGGIAMSLHPLAIDNLEAIQLLPLAGILWVFDALLRTCEQPCKMHALEFACALVLTASLSLHHFLFLCLLLPPAVLGLLVISATRHHSSKPSRESQLAQTPGIRNPFRLTWQTAPKQKQQTLIALLTGSLLAALVLLFLIMPMHRIHEQYAFTRNPQTVRALSADLFWWLSISDGWISSVEPEQRSPLLPGLARTFLASSSLLLLGVRQNPAVRLFAIVWVVSFCLSFGNQLQLGSWTPWETLCDWFSPLARIRSPYRFAYFTQIAMLILAALAIAPLGILLQRSLRRALMRVPGMAGNPRRRSRIATIGSKFAVACLLGALALEIPPPRTFMVHLPVSEKQYPWVQFIAEHAGSNDQLLCLPVAATLSEFDCEVASRWMIYGTLHGRPILNGYSGYFPERWQRMRARLHQQPLTQSLLEDVHELGTDWVVIRKRDYPWSLTESEKLRLAFEDASIQVFKVL